jgi:hypothetical protein
MNDDRGGDFGDTKGNGGRVVTALPSTKPEPHTDATAFAINVRRITATTIERLPSAPEVPMRIPARDLAVGDVLHINDWRLHVIHIERGEALAVLTEEFAFLIHFGNHYRTNGQNSQRAVLMNSSVGFGLGKLPTLGLASVNSCRNALPWESRPW